MTEFFPSITVITVCLNAKEGLEKTINSVLGQTYQKLEHVVVDGGSSDGSVDVLNRVAEDRLIYRSEPDGGIYEAMNKGIGLSTSELIMFLNAGDYFVSTGALEYMVSKLRLAEADLFFGRIVWDDPTSRNIILSNHNFSWFDWDLRRSNFPHPATIYKRKLFTELGPFDEAFRVLGDYEWNAKALVKHRKAFQYVDIALVVFRADGVSNQQETNACVEKEHALIARRYFQPEWLFSIAEKNGTNKRRLKEKVLAKLYAKKLNRIL